MNTEGKEVIQMKMVEFIGLVDRMVQSEMGVSIHDLPDQDWTDFWWHTITPEDAKEMAAQCVADIKEAEGFSAQHGKERT